MTKKNIKKFDITLSKAKSIIYSPMITEKSTMISQFNHFCFRVNKHSNATEIKLAIQKLFKVKVKKVNIINMMGKTKTFKGTKGKRADFKKAIVTLAQDNTIDISTGI